METLSFDECRALYFNDAVLFTQPFTLYRLQGHAGGRYYYRFKSDLDGGDPEFYISVTTMIRQTLPTSPFLIKWIADMGEVEAEKYKFERSVYGTMMHMCFQKLLIEREIDMDDFLPNFIKGYMTNEGVSLAFYDEWIDDIRRAILGFAQFIIDYKIKPILIEGVLAHPDGYAGAVDLVCQMDVEVNGFYGEMYKSGPRKGEPKETKMLRTINAIVDFKSGMKGFFPEHEIQLEAYRRLVKHNFPHLANEFFRIFNYAPSEWRGTTPNYKLKDQTESDNIEKFDHLVSLAKIEWKKNPRKVLNITGIVRLDDDIRKNIEEVSFDTLVKRIDNERKNQTTGSTAEFIINPSDIGEDQNRNEE